MKLPKSIMTVQGGEILTISIRVGTGLSQFWANRLPLACWLSCIVAIAVEFWAINPTVPPAWAATTKSGNLQAQLVSEVKTIQSGMPFWVALELKTRPGWHVYWQNPGDSGAAPRLEWSLPNGFKAGELVFPY